MGASGNQADGRTLYTVLCHIIYKNFNAIILVASLSSIIELVDSNLALKLSVLASVLSCNITDANSLQTVYREIVRALDDLQSELTLGYRKLATSRDEHEHEHANECSEAKTNVLEVLQNLQLFSSFLPKFLSTGFPLLNDFFHEFSNALSKRSNGEPREHILSFIMECFKSRSDKLITLMVTFLNTTP